MERPRSSKGTAVEFDIAVNAPPRFRVAPLCPVDLSASLCMLGVKRIPNPHKAMLMEFREYLRYYNLEEYLFSEVNASFQHNRTLIPEEFLAIIIWKSNRSKTNIVYGFLAAETAVGTHERGSRSRRLGQS